MKRMKTLTNSYSADIRELQVDVTYIRERIDEVVTSQKYTNGKVAKTMIDLQELRDSRSLFATKEELSAVRTAPLKQDSEWVGRMKLILIAAFFSFLSALGSALLVLRLKG